MSVLWYDCPGTLFCLVVQKAMATSVGTGGFTVSLSTLTGGSSSDGFSDSNIDAAINVHWIAVG